MRGIKLIAIPHRFIARERALYTFVTDNAETIYLEIFFSLEVPNRIVSIFLHCQGSRGNIGDQGDDGEAGLEVLLEQ